MVALHAMLVHHSAIRLPYSPSFRFQSNPTGVIDHWITDMRNDTTLILNENQHNELVSAYMEILYNGFKGLLSGTANGDTERIRIELEIIRLCDEFAAISGRLINRSRNVEQKVFFQIGYASFCHRSITCLLR
jgi:hypothetical protein